MSTKSIESLIEEFCGDHWLFYINFENSLYYLSLLQNRINAFSNEHATPNTSDKLWTIWSNMKAMLNTADPDYYTEVMYFSAVMSKKIDEFSVNNMLSGNQTISRILYELDMIKVCAYSILNT